MSDHSDNFIKPDILIKQHKQNKRSANLLALGEGQQNCLCCNKSACCCPPSGNNSAEDKALQYLASLLVKVSLAQIEHEHKKGK